MTSTTSTATTPSSAEPLVHSNGGVLTITVSTAAAGTSLADDALAGGAQALREVARGQREAGAILLVGAGANFCAGGNVRAFAAAEDRPTYLRGLADNFHAMVAALYEADRPVVAAVKGWAAGAGMSLVLHADVAIGGESTRMRPAYRGIGLTPDGGMTWTLPRAVGAARARNIILTDRVISASEAADWGLLSEVVADDDVDAVARAAAEKIAAGPWQADQGARRLLSAAPDHSLVEHLALEAQSIALRSGAPEGREGVDAFIGKRKPDWAASR
ncbi:enoyl-CoA hydratase/isomerase family protein [Gordonia sp. ABSL49_1]|uniref:enoyl-CoA hydratase/isomerase family protein n=1 Tax=Gordonia sp. ABSL49_1 TaxID=2920941 RepID=UPI001F0FED74|nr:enoyl-CoA hydratase-related protein [Gordonia sp. ABSL49_1]MCH5643058.1 enoyl-CoA hydratase-related protein [Gordonia sp. ABSL49_1]